MAAMLANHQRGTAFNLCACPCLENIVTVAVIGTEDHSGAPRPGLLLHDLLQRSIALKIESRNLFRDQSASTLLKTHGTISVQAKLPAQRQVCRNLWDRRTGPQLGDLPQRQ